MSNYCIESLRLNKFRESSLPSRRDLYERVGRRDVPYESSTKDPREFSDPVNFPDIVNKVDALSIGYHAALQERRAADLVNAAVVANPAVQPSVNQAVQPSVNQTDTPKNIPDDPTA